MLAAPLIGVIGAHGDLFGFHCDSLIVQFSRVTATPPRKDDFERELERQTLISELRRATILGWSVAAIFVVLTVYSGSHGFHSGALPGGGYPLLVLGIWILFEWGATVILTHRIREGRERLPHRVYIGTVIEVAMPTIIMAIMCRYDSPLNVLTSPVSYGYFLLVILSPLRLDLRLCVATGMLSAVSYGVLVGCYMDDIQRQWLGSYAVMHLSFFMRGVMLIVGGFAAGFVSQRIHTTLVETLREVKERERVIGLFGQHVSPTVVNQLLSQPTGESSDLREVCVLVLDIRGFTTYSENRAADEVVLYLNTLWGFMVHTVNEHQGFVNKFLGDGFLAVFGAPLSTGNDCADAIAAARRILDEVDELVASGALPPTQVGLALHAGPAIVGNIGSAERKEYTVIGDVVNVAFRIEALNKDFGSRLLISEPVRQAAGITDGERIPAIAIRGRRDSVDLFRLA